MLSTIFLNIFFIISCSVTILNLCNGEVAITESVISKRNEISQYCIKLVNESDFPKCKISFREEGNFQTFNGTCLQDNVFLITSNRTRPEVSEAEDHKYLAAIYEDQLPPYARISCTSLFPTNFDFEGVGALDFFRVWKGQTRTVQNTTYTINAEVLLSPEATGKYIFYSINNSDIRTTIFIFSERGSRPYLIGGSRVIPAVKLNATVTAIPCITSDLNINITLFRQNNQSNWIKLNSSSSNVLDYDPQEGFIMNTNSTIPGDYRCSSNNQNGSEEYEYVTVHVTSPGEDIQSPHEKGKEKLAIEIINSKAVCYSIKNNTNSKIHFSNAYTQNPIESQLLIKCLQQKNPYCGSHSYHQRREGRKNNLKCPKNSTSCVWITNIHPQGIFYCEFEDTAGESINEEYFTGLDKKIYDASNTSGIIPNILIHPKLMPNLTILKTGINFRISCQAVGLILLRDPFTISIKYKNGTIFKKDLIWWAGPMNKYLSIDMEEIICSDNFWSTNLLISSGIKINVTENTCEEKQFKCNDGKCIRDDLRCDGGQDCDDNSDEDKCLTHRCKDGFFKCVTGMCIPNRKKCNNKDDCSDGSDESTHTCSNVTCSSTKDFKCTSGQCTSLNLLCDGHKDCFDQSDEARVNCAKYYPQFIQTETKYNFTLNTKNELVCKTKELPLKLKPILSWWRNGQNFSDTERLWFGVKGSKLALRFENINPEDEGEYKCIATNKLQKVEYVYTVIVEIPKQDLSCRPELNSLDCFHRGCSYVKNTCVESDGVDVSTIAKAPTSTESHIIMVTSSAPSSVQEAALKADDSHSTVGVSIVVSILIFLVVAILVVSGLRWRGHFRCPGSTSTTTTHDDTDGVLRGIQLQSTNV